MDKLIRAIAVRDAGGEELVLFEYQRSSARHPGRRMALCTGEVAACLGKDTFVLLSTGEKLTRVRGPKRRAR